MSQALDFPYGERLKPARLVRRVAAEPARLPATSPSPLPSPPPVRRGHALAVERLSKRFGDRVVLDGFDLAIRPGEFVALVGRSGCGKSTLLRLVAGLDQADGGALRFDATTREQQPPSLRIMFQDARLLPWKRVIDNVALGLPSSGSAHADDVLAQVGLRDRARDWPGVLSGGQRQRVALARALVHDPRLLLLDEPLGALDALTRIEMQQLIEALWLRNAMTAVLVTHDVAEAVALADRVILVEGGRVALDLKIDLPRPRARGSAAFGAYQTKLLERVLGRSLETTARP